LEEKIKWGFPHFDYKGQFASMAAFRAHASIGFWKAGLLLEKVAKSGEGMGQFGRVTSMKDLPSKKVLVNYIKAAMKLNDLGVTPVRKKAAPKEALKPPPAFVAALKKNKKALAHFTAFTPGKRRDYLEWIVEAKTEETRARRIVTTIEWVSEGKSRNWKYQNC
jgi:uncharacterized protein YdeI (YjbR/CyaY-like superfamily)